MKGHVIARHRPGRGYTRVALVAMLIASFFVIAPPARAAAVVVVSPTSVSVSEAGATATYDVSLQDPPTADVYVTISDDSQVDVDKTLLTFTTSDYGIQTVTVSAQLDLVAEGSHTGTVTHAIRADSAAEYLLAPVPASVTANITDNDTAGVSVVQSGGSTNVTEGGATDSYTVVLTSQPTADVTITVSPNAQVSRTPTSPLQFTAGPSGTWNIPQTVTVSAVNDSVVEGPHSGVLTHAAASGDASYNGISISSVTANITDNDTAGVSVVQSGGSTNVTEGGATDSYTVVLTSQPTADVTITVSPNAQVSRTPTSPLQFTAGPSGTWNIPQTVTVSAVNDSVVEGPHSGVLTHAAASGDASYNGISISSVTANITDNDTAGVSVVQSGGSTNVTEGGATDSYTVVLTSQPTADVTVSLAGGPDVSLSALVPFNSGNWSTPQTVTVTAVNDAIVEGPEVATITHTASSADTNYNLSGPSVTANITDNNFGVAFQLASSNATEGNTGSTPAIVNLIVDTNGLPSDNTGPAVPAGATVEVARTGGTAAVNEDFTFTSPTTVSIARSCRWRDRAGNGHGDSAIR